MRAPASDQRYSLGTKNKSLKDDVWIRFVGMLASIIGGYDILVARAGLDRFIPCTGTPLRSWC